MGSSKNNNSKGRFSPTLIKGFKYLGIALPLLFIAPVLMTIGFKSLRQDNSFLVLILGIVLAIATIIIVIQGIRIILNSFFENEK